MRSPAIMAIALILLAGCDSEVSRRAFAEARTESGTASCTHASVCMTCMPGVAFDGSSHMNCAAKWSAFCPGRQPAEITVRTFDVTYESGAKRIVETREVTKRTGECR